MLTKRIIPCLDVTGGRVVKGISFVQLRDAGDPVELAAFYDKEGADELVFLDITASSDHRDIMADVVARVSEQVFIPLTVGGGLRNLEDMRRILESGADKVAINTSAVQNPVLVKEGARKFGSQCIVVAVDAKRRDSQAVPLSGSPVAVDKNSKWEVYIHGGRTPTGVDALKWAKYVADLGAGEILLTSMDADGHQTGYDNELNRTVSEAITIPVIASGGAGTIEHLYEAIVDGKADAVLAASIFHYGTFSIKEVKLYLGAKGIPVRI
ncbi:MAG: imidazole glycerol phosphate synthase subunit HisF [Dehalococcoidia bacterium]|nr:imidazole glycerol phosphate synthase subunit HisF [Dehalococcoidia bacterium]